MAVSTAINGGHHLHHQLPVFRTDSTLSNSSFASSYGSAGSGEQLLLLPLAYSNYMEKRQLFLRSYQFSRKQTFADRIKTSLRRFRRLVFLRLRSARRLRRVVWSRLRSSLSRRRRRRFIRLIQRYNAGLSGCSDSCFL